MTPLTTRQLQVLEAAVDLVNGGLDMEEALMCYRIISQYVLSTVPRPEWPSDDPALDSAQDMP